MGDYRCLEIDEARGKLALSAAETLVQDLPDGNVAAVAIVKVRASDGAAGKVSYAANGVNDAVIDGLEELLATLKQWREKENADA